MADNKNLNNFPNISDKLNAPKKISTFERSRQEAESKRLREEAENRKALRDFTDSLGDADDDPVSQFANGRSAFSNDPPRGFGHNSGSLGGSRDFPSNDRSRNAGPGSLGPPPVLKRKREQEERDDRRRSGARDGTFGGSSSRQRDSRRDLYNSDEDDEMDNLGRKRSPEPAVRKPTMLLQLLPLQLKKSHVRDLIPDTVKVDGVDFIAFTGRDARNQRTQTAIVTLAANTPVSDIDTVVSALQNRYLGFGCYLKISRHVSTSGSGGLASSTTSLMSLNETNPFGAKQAITHPVGGSLRTAPPPSSYGNHPPPNSYSATGTNHQQKLPGLVQVDVLPPSDVKQLKLIHSTAENLMTYGAEFEALLMSRPLVQQDEKWAWLFDTSSQGGVYYRWLLWKQCSEDVNSVPDVRPASDGTNTVFNSGPLWVQPLDKTKFEDVTEFEDLVDDDGYISSEDESGDEGERKQYNIGVPPPISEDDHTDGQPKYLNPYRRAKLTHLLARLPESIARLRTGDVARVTNFVVNNAGVGAEEIVDILLTNIEHPFSQTVHYDHDSDADSSADELPRKPENETIDSIEGSSRKDPSNAKLIGLYLVSDAIQASSTSGVRDAWKYRSLFEVALTQRKTFDHLGRLERDLAWGRMKSEQWKRKVGMILQLWEQWSVFPAEAQEAFKAQFAEPEISLEERLAKEEEAKKEAAEKEKMKWRSAEEASKARIEEEEKRIKEEERKKEEAAEKIRVMKEKVALAAGKKNRPTAEDLFDAPPEEIVVEPPLQTQAPPPKVIGFGFKMSLGPSVGGIKSAEKSSPAQSQSSTPKPVDMVRGDMFEASDDEE